MTGRSENEDPRPLLGARASDDGTVEFRVWAPNAQTVIAAGFSSMMRCADSGSLTLSGWKTGIPRSLARSATGGS